MRTHRLTIAVMVLFGLWCVTTSSAGEEIAWTENERAAGFTVAARPAISPYPCGYQVAGRSEIEGPISVALAGNEYEAVQVAVYALPKNQTPLRDVKIDVRIDLPVSVYEVRHVGTWNDVRDEPVAHALWETGRIAEIAPGRSGVFWITLHAGADAEAGIHEGSVSIRAGGSAVRRALAVEVHPFVLPKPNVLYGFWYTDIRIPKQFWNDDYQLLYMRDMAAHGMNSASFSSCGRRDGTEEVRDLSEFDRWPLAGEMKLARKAGLTRRDIPILLVGSNFNNGTATHGLGRISDPKRFASGLHRKQQENRWPEFLLAIGDEPSPEGTARYEELTAPWRDTPLRTYVALNALAVYSLGLHYDNWFVLVGNITPAMQREAKWLGAQVCSYTFDLRGTNHRANRYYAGLYSWKWDLAGNSCWAYMASPKVSMTADGRIVGGYPGFGFALSSPKGPIGTVGYEGRREGVDDVRYLQALEFLLERADERTAAATEAQEWLTRLRSRIDEGFFREVSVGEMWYVDHLDPNPGIGIGEYDDIRRQAAGYIRQLLAADLGLDLPAHFKRAAVKKRTQHPWASFEGKDVAACIKGLDSDSPATPRAAAYALAEMGPEAAPAVPALIALIDDEDVRMVAFRALERIGPEARAATPALASALENEDGFVRVGAAFALMGIGPEALGAVLPAIHDPFGSTARTVVGWIDRNGFAAEVVSELIKVLETGANSDPRVRAAAAIGKTGQAGAQAVPVLVKMLSDPQARMRRCAAGALGELGPVARDALPALQSALGREGEYSSVTSVIEPAITKIGGDEKE